MTEQRVEPDPLDVPLLRRDLLDMLHELGHRKGEPVTHAQVVANALEQHFRHEWSRKPKPEKLESVTDKAHDED